MAQIKSDNPIDSEISKFKALLIKIQVTAQGFMASYTQLPIKERARIFNEITKTINSMDAFITKAKGSQITNSGTRFSLDNFKNSFSSFSLRWKKFERTMDKSS